MNLLHKNVMVKEVLETEQSTESGLFIASSKMEFGKPITAEIVKKSDDIADDRIAVGKYAVYMPGIAVEVFKEDNASYKVLDADSIMMVQEKAVLDPSEF